MNDIESGIQELLAGSGFIIISIGEYYVQLAKQGGENSVLMEAVSHEFLETLPNREPEFSALGFALEPGSNYQKTYAVEPGLASLLTSELTTIFEEIYNVPLLKYVIEKELD